MSSEEKTGAAADAAAASGSAGDMSEDVQNMKSPTNKAVSAQLAKLRDANAKYKNLLKMAKERIQKQEEKIEEITTEMNELKEKDLERNETASMAVDELEAAAAGDPETFRSLVKVVQRVRVPIMSLTQPMEESPGNAAEEIWALLEYEVCSSEAPDPIMSDDPKRFQQWKKFETEHALADFIRKDTGEPLTLPPFSLTPAESARIQEQAKQEVSQITEEFRRFRVRSELARKQADAHIRELQSSHVQRAQRRIEGSDLDHQTERSVSAEREELERLKAEMTAQEANWKEAYDVLFQENEALRSSGSEALLAAQWRQRYDNCMAEKQDLQSRLQLQKEKMEQEREEDAGRYEMKYRDLKESFRLYRKKAKEIFEAQQSGDASSQLLALTERGSEQSKLSYLKNLMVNYLSSDAEMRQNMQLAIGTVLQFTPEDLARIEEKRKADESWF